MALEPAQEPGEEDEVLLVLAHRLVLTFGKYDVLVRQRTLYCLLVLRDVAGQVVQLLILDEHLHDELVLEIAIGEVGLDQFHSRFTTVLCKFGYAALE